MSYADDDGYDGEERPQQTTEAPTLEKAGAGYHVQYPRAGIEARVDRVRVEHGNTYCQLKVFAIPRMAGQARRFLTRGNFNLDGPRVRSDWAKHLRPLFEADWLAILESLSNAVLSVEEEGAPAVLLRDAPLPQQGQHVLEPLLLSRLPTCWFGKGGDMKSYIALAAAISLQSGLPLLGMEPRRKMRVGYLDWELDWTTHGNRLRRLLAVDPDFPKDDLPDLTYIDCYRSFARDYERISHIVAENGLEFLVIDSIGYACAGSAIEESQTAIEFGAALRALNVGSLSLAHTRKTGEDPTQMPFGSSYWHNSFRSTFYVKAQSEPGSDHMDLGLFNRKFNTTRPAHPYGLHVEFKAPDFTGPIVITPTSVQDVAELAQQTPLKARIKHLLRTGPMTAKQMGEELEADDHVIRTAIRRSPDDFFRLSANAGQAERFGLADRLRVSE